MDFLKKIQIFFAIIIVFAMVILVLNWYDSYSFKNNPIPLEYRQAIDEKEQEVLHYMKKNLGFKFQVPIVVTDKIPGKIFGVTSMSEDGKITIYLNKKVMKESMDYILDSVIAHEYAHAVLFKTGDFKRGTDGHSELWRQVCIKLGGLNCQKYVDSHDVIMRKLPTIFTH